MRENGTQATKEEILDLCKSDRQLAEQLYSELFIYLNYNETLIEVDAQTCEAGHEKPTWTQNFMHRIRQALHMRGIEIEFDTSEVIELIRETSSERGYNLQAT